MMQYTNCVVKAHKVQSIKLTLGLHKYKSCRRRRRYLFGSNSITYNYTNDKIKQISRARLSENPEVDHAGHPNIQFLVYLETTTTILLKNTQRNKYRKK